MFCGRDKDISVGLLDIKCQDRLKWRREPKAKSGYREHFEFFTAVQIRETTAEGEVRTIAGDYIQFFTETSRNRSERSRRLPVFLKVLYI